MSASLPLSYCARLVRDHDYDRYLCTLFSPVSVREAWFVLFAFNHEIATIAEMVSEEIIGHMRFAWWRDALDAIYAGKAPPKHPVAEPLAEIIRTYQLPRAPLDAMLAARTLDLQTEPFEGLVELESYCRDTSASLLEVCSVAAGIALTPALQSLGIAWALIGMMRSGRNADAAAAEEMKAATTRHLEAARLDRRGSLAAFVPFIDTCGFYLSRLQKGKDSTSPSSRLWLLVTLTFRRLV